MNKTRKNILNIFLLIIPLVALTLFLFFKKNNYKTVSQSEASGLPALYVDGNVIKRSDTHNKVQLKGVSSMAFVYENYPFDKLIKILERLKLWKINILGLYIDPLILKNTITELDRIVDWTEKNHIYVYLMPRASDFRDLQDQLKQFPPLMNQLAKRYAHRNNVIYGFWAEPNITWTEWYKHADITAKEIIKEKPDALMIITGTEYSRKYDLNKQLPYKNLIYDFHDYPATDINELIPILKKDKLNYLWDKVADIHPVLVGEFGGVWKYGFGSPEDLEYIKIILDNINKNGLSYTAHTLDKGSIGPGPVDWNTVTQAGLEIIDWNTLLLTKKGELIMNDLLKYPPTDFGKK